MLIGYWMTIDAISIEKFRCAAREFGMEDLIDRAPRWTLIAASFMAMMFWPVIIAFAIYGAIGDE